jgi:hypothetical protein
MRQMRQRRWRINVLDNAPEMRQMRHQKVLKTIGNTKGSKCLRQPDRNPTNEPGKWAQGWQENIGFEVKEPKAGIGEG